MSAIEYSIAHPDWRSSRRKIEEDLLEQLYADRQAGAKVQDADDNWIPSGGLDRWQLEAIAKARADKTLQRAIAMNEDVIEFGRGLGAA